jgi:hypothetical protein
VTGDAIAAIGSPRLRLKPPISDVVTGSEKLL